MAAHGLADGPLAADLDLTSRAQSSELANLEARLCVVDGLLDALGRADDIHKIIQFSADRAEARAALQAEPFLYTSQQADAVLDMPFHWQSADVVQRLHAEREQLLSRRAGLHEHVAEVLTLHWFG